ncbi:MAG: DNA-processing protein DprA [Bacillota bacterium]|nr:DNA-processing protein DprA [Bacillota bacterium]
MNESTKYAIWISQALGYANPKVKRIIELYKGFKEFYEGGRQEWILSGVLSPKNLQKLESTPLNVADPIINRCRELKYDIISIGDNEYPVVLQEIFNPPAALYVSGNLPNVDNRFTIAIVGTRKSSFYGVKIAYEFSYHLAKAGSIIVSGGALGIDSAAHKGSLSANGDTICVLGCGIHNNYLQQNEALRKTISETGALISEYPPDYPVNKGSFPVRNRIISALSKAALVVEAGNKSGSLITANLALEQGRDVFAVPGSINSSVSAGTNELIKVGAIPATTYRDILEAYETQYEFNEIDDNLKPIKPEDFLTKNISKQTKQVRNVKIQKASEKPFEQPKKQVDLSGLSQATQNVFNFLSEEPKHIDTIILELNLPPNQVAQALTELELVDAVTPLAGRSYCIK